MMNFDEVRQSVLSHIGATGSMKECQDAFAAGDLVVVQPAPGRMVARDVLATFRIRAETSKKAGIETCGFDDALSAIAGLPTDEEVLMFHLSSPQRIFSLFVSERQREVIGCIRVTRRGT